MSANPSKDLNLNLDAVPLEDQHDICGAIVTKCSDTTSVSVSETLSEGRVDQVRVSDEGEDLVEPLMQGSDIHAEGILKKDVDVPVASISVNGGGDEIDGDRFDGLLLQKVSCLEDEAGKTGIEVVKVECSMKITESLVEQNQVVVEGQVAAMLEEGILNPSCLEKNRSLETTGGSTAENAVIDAVPSVGVESFPNSDLKRSSMPNPGTSEIIIYTQDEKQEEVAEADEMVSNQVDGDEILDSHSVEKTPNSGPCVTVDSDSIDVVTETVRPLQDWNLDSEVQVVDACPSPSREDQNMGTCDFELDTSPEEENQAKACPSPPPEDQNMGTCDSELNTSPEEENQTKDCPSPPPEDQNMGTCDSELNTFPEEENQTKACPSPPREDQNMGTCDSELNNTSPEEENQTKACPSPPPEDQNMGTCDSELDTSPEEENQTKACPSPPREDQNMGTCDFELDTSPEGENQIKAFPSPPPEDQNMGTCDSELDAFPEEENQTKACPSPPREDQNMGTCDSELDTSPEEENQTKDCPSPSREHQNMGTCDSELDTSPEGENQTKACPSPPREDQNMGTCDSELDTSPKEETQTKACSSPLREDENMGTCDSELNTSPEEVNQTKDCPSPPPEDQNTGTCDSELDTSPEEENQTKACPSPPREDQNMGTCDSELDTSPEEENQTKEVDIKTEVAGEACKQDENQTGGSQVSEVRPIQFSGNESNMGSLVIDLETCSITAGNQNTGDEVANEDTCLPNDSCIKGVEIKVAESDIDDNAADDATDVSCDGNQKIETTEQVTLFEQLENVEEILNPSCLEKNRSLETMGGSTAVNALIDDVPSVGVESFPNNDHRRSSMANPGTCENIICTQDEEQEQEEVAEADEMVSNQVDGDEILDLHSVEKTPNDGPCVTVDSDSIAVVTETVRPLQDWNLDPEVQVVDACPSPPREDQNMGTCDFELDTFLKEENQTKEVDIKTEAAGELRKQDENQISGSQISEVRPIQFSGNESNMGSLVVDSETCSVTAGNQNTGDEVANEDTCLPNDSCIEGVEIKEAESDIDDSAADDATDVSCDGNQKIETTEQVTLFEQLENVEKEMVYQVSLKHGTASEDKFSVSDLVWGKVKNHPWWPGQIFDPSDSSEYAKKYQKNDRFLVSYFGDQTFAWNKASSLKHFQTHFSQMEKQTNLKAFHDAVECALNEVSRRVELGLSCSCTPEDAYSKIKSQVIKNAGIREEASIRNFVDKSPSVTLFEPVKLLESIKALALYPHSGGDRLELVIAQAQLVAFYRLKGYFQLPEFQVYGGLLENDAEHATPVSKTEEQATSGKRKLKSQDSSSRKRRHILENALNPRRKERRLSELMDGKNSSPYGVNGVKNVADERGASKSATLSSGKKLKDVDSFSDNLVVQKRKQMLLRSKNSDTEFPTTHNVGERIRRIASQLIGSPSVLKHCSERFQKSAVKVDRRNKKLHGDDVDVSPRTPERSRKRKIVIPKEYSSLDEMLSQLCLAARDPMKGYSFLTILVDFFTDFRNSISLDHSSSGKLKQSTKKFSGGKTDGRNGQPSNSKTGSAETFNYRNDSYWTDRIIQSSPEEQPLHNNRKRKGDSQIQSSTRKDSQPNPDCKSNLVTGKPVDDFSPTALILNFTEPDSIPSEADLNKIFSRFGPLKETETEVLRKATRARVVFKSHNDAEVAFSSAGKFSIFGRTTLVSYQLAATEGRKNATSLEGNIS